LTSFSVYIKILHVLSYVKPEKRLFYEKTDFSVPENAIVWRGSTCFFIRKTIYTRGRDAGSGAMPERRETGRNRTAQGAEKAAGGGDLAHRRGRLKTAKTGFSRLFSGKITLKTAFFSIFSIFGLTFSLSWLY